MSSLTKIFSPKAKNLTKDVLGNNPVVAMPDSFEIKKNKLRQLSRARAGMAGGLNTKLSEPK